MVDIMAKAILKYRDPNFVDLNDTSEVLDTWFDNDCWFGDNVLDQIVDPDDEERFEAFRKAVVSKATNPVFKPFEFKLSDQEKKDAEGMDVKDYYYHLEQAPNDVKYAVYALKKLCPTKVNVKKQELIPEDGDGKPEVCELSCNEKNEFTLAPETVKFKLNLMDRKTCFHCHSEWYYELLGVV